MPSKKDNTPSPLEQKVLELEQLLETAQLRLEESNSARLRALADLQNHQRREAENRASWGSIAVCTFLKHTIPSFLELQLGATHTSDANIKAVIDKFFTSLTQSGLQKIEPTAGDPLDTNAHEVMMQAEGKAGCVVSTLEPGWQYQNTVIIPAKVSAAMQN
ncbi:MAG TPA: nucleotide exchange factor GrpE [Candidatus Gracilibacteria bacterium]